MYWMSKKSIPKGNTVAALAHRTRSGRINQRSAKTAACLIALLSFILLSAAAFGQSGNASLTGTIQDASGGVVPGASIVARNVDTGVETKTTSNNSGSYTIPSLQPGMYELNAEAAGFSRATRSGIRLNVGMQNRLDVTLSVAGTVTEIAVTGAAESMVLEAGSSTGTVMQEEILSAIPMLSNNILDLVQIMGGVTAGTSDPTFGAEFQQFAGVNSTQINITRDGMSVSEIRFRTGVNASSNINPEMVSEFRMVLSPVDAEMGRGAGQVQMTTRSGSNAFHGSGTWSIQNTALDSRDFSAKLNNTPKAWRNLNNYMLTASGPIIKNRTFFFVTWEQQMARTKRTTTVKVLTPCARKGIYRYISDPRPARAGWIPGAATENNTFNPDGGYTRPSVDFDGNILLGGRFYNSQSDTAMDEPMGRLEFESVFGPLNPSIRATLADPGNIHGASGDCGDLNFNGMTGQYGVTQAWDTRAWAQGGRAYRHQYDPTGFVDRFTNGVEGLVGMPPVNNWTIGDGLNYAGYRWVQSIKGEGGSLYGIGADAERKSITFKIDHNINNNHRLSGTYSLERFLVDDAYPFWPQEYGGYGGTVSRKPQSLMINLTSTLRPTLLNEFRLGLNRSYSYQQAPIDGSNGDKIKEVLQALLPTSGQGSIFSGTAAEGMQMLLGVGEGASTHFHIDPNNSGSNGSHPYGGNGGGGYQDYIRMTWGGVDPRWTYSDTVTWMKGAHSFKGGVEWRRQSTFQDFAGSTGWGNCVGGCATNSDIPVIFGGALTSVTERRRGVLGSYNAGGANDNGSWRGIAITSQDNGTVNPSGNYSTPYQMMSYFSGSLIELRQFFYAVPDAGSPTGARWSDLEKGEKRYNYTIANKELHFFFKDDWKVTRDLTLNLGVRYEYYGVPHAKDGRTIAMKGGSDSLWGINGPGFDTWMKNRNYVKTAPGVIPDPVTVYQFVGPGSAHSDQMAWNKDMNNLAPHLGFAWQLPWLGKGLMTLRGGWSISYGQITSFDQFGVLLADVGGATPSLPGRFQGGSGDRGVFKDGNYQYYMDITDLPNLLPLHGNMFGVEPFSVQPVGRFYSSATSFNNLAMDNNIRNPYTHNFNMSLTRNIGRNLTVDVRYIGTMGRSQFISANGGLNLNTANFIDNGLYKEFEIVRRGGQSAVINSLIPHNGPAGTQQYLVSNYPNRTGSEQLRQTSSSTYSNLAAGSFSGVASTLSTSNGTGTGILAARFTGDVGNLLRAGCLPEDRSGYLAAFASDPMTNVNNFPCQYGTPWNFIVANPQYSNAEYRYNAALTNYNSLQAQVTLRPTRGLNFQATYTWSRNLTDTGWSNYLGDRDYVLSGQHRSHTLNTYGSWELPFGANGFFFRGASGAFKKAIEGWQFSWITAMGSGSPVSVTGASTMWGTSYPVLVRPDLWDEKAGHATETWDGDRFAGGKYYGDKYMKVLDRNICNGDMMAGNASTSGTLYYQYCERNTGGNSVLYGPRALALVSGRDASGNLLPLRYDSLEEARKYDPAAQMDVVGFNSGSPIYAPPPVIVFRNANQSDFDPANPGAYLGNYSSGRLTGLGNFSFDMAMTKSIEFMEGKRLEVRVDAQNILNHPTPSGGSPTLSYGGRRATTSNPSFAVNSSAVFGNIPNKGGHRTFQGRLSLRF